MTKLLRGLREGGFTVCLSQQPRNIDNGVINRLRGVLKCLEVLGDSTRTGKDLLFLDCAHTGVVSYCNDEARWLFCKGIAYGHKLCKFTVFTEFSDRFCFPSGVLSEDDLDELHEDIWNEMN